MSDQELRDKLASDDRACAAEEWPLSKNWQLYIQSCPGEKPFEAFDFIKVEAHGPNEYRRPITSIMVPKIDGFVCQSHSFIAGLIHQNTKAVEQERDQLKAQCEKLAEALEKLEAGYAGMFGTDTMSHLDDAWSTGQQIVSDALAEYRKEFSK